MLEVSFDFFEVIGTPNCKILKQNHVKKDV